MHPSEEDSGHDAYRSAATLTVLLLLWGTVSLFVVPWQPFWIPNVAQSVAAVGLLLYLARTWSRPNRDAAEAICVLIIVYTLLLLPWTAVVWCRLGRPLEAFTIPQGAIIAVALVSPARRTFTLVAMCLFLAESAFVIFYARHVGLEQLLPITEPLGTLGFAILGFGLWLLRRRRVELGRDFVRVQAEIQALARIRPQFLAAREQLDAEITRLAADVPASYVVGRALDRLADLRAKIGRLVAEGGTPTAQDAERRLLEHDAQLGAIVFSAIGVTLAIPVLLWSHSQLQDVPTPLFLAQFSLSLALLLYLVSTRERPSSSRAMWAVVAMFVTGLPIITLNQHWLLQLDRPYVPFMGHKLLMGILGLCLATRFRMGAYLIVITASCAIVQWFTLDLGAHPDIVSVSEPWVTIIYMMIGLVSLFLVQQRQVTSLQLLRARAEVSAMHRRAVMFLALRDRLNSPLQTLVLGATAATATLPLSRGARVHESIDRLVELSRNLSELDELILPLETSLDADHELRRQL